MTLSDHFEAKLTAGLTLPEGDYPINPPRELCEIRTLVDLPALTSVGGDLRIPEGCMVANKKDDQKI